jgi:hypothetical protein
MMTDDDVNFQTNTKISAKVRQRTFKIVSLKETSQNAVATGCEANKCR